MTSVPAPDAPADARGRRALWPRMLLGLCVGAILGASLAWFAEALRTADDEEDEEAAVGTGSLVLLGIEVLGLVRTLFQLLKRL